MSLFRITDCIVASLVTIHMHFATVSLTYNYIAWSLAADAAPMSSIGDISTTQYTFKYKKHCSVQ